MHKTHSYLLRLKPIGPFFFGGRQEPRNARTRDYLVKSRHFPQQTGVLGALRHYLLLQAGLADDSGKGGKVKNTTASIAAVGPQGFSLSPSNDHAADFGLIHSISPIFLIEDRIQEKAEAANLSIENRYRFWQPAPLIQQLRLELCATPAQAHIGESKQAVRLQGLDAKLPTHHNLYCHEANVKPKSYDDCFLLQDQVGILKGKAGKTEDDAYFKQSYFQLKKEFAFACYVQLNQDEAQTISLKARTMNMGGERSVFKLELIPVSKIQMPQLPHAALPLDALPKLILTSDSLADASIMTACHFAAAETIDFKFLRTQIDKTERYNQLSRDGKDTRAQQRSAQYQLLKRGSVLYPKNMQVLIDLLNKSRLQQIGLNHFVVLNPDTSTQYYPI